MDTIATAAVRLRQRQTTSVALVDASLEAIAAHNARVNAFITVAADAARQAAAAADAELARGFDRGPLHGIPVSIKDLIDQAGIVTTAASTVLDDRVPTADAEVVTRLRAAGAVIIGRTNLHQFAVGTTSEDSAFGPVRHPMDSTRSAGGSSGGSAAAVVSGMGLASLGTDTGGSVRIPSAVCGLVGLKATTGEIPNTGVVPMSETLDHVGPLALTVQDAAWIYDVLAGRVARTLAPRSAGAMRLVRLGGYFDELDPYVRRAFDAAVGRLMDAGATIGQAEIAGTDAIVSTYANIALPELAEWHAPYLDARADRYVPAIHARIAHGRTISAVDYLRARHTASHLSAAVDALLADCDALVLPTVPIPAPPLGQADVRLDPATSVPMPVRSAMLKHTQLFNLTGHPAVSIPVPSEVPVGLQLVGRRHATAALLDLAGACERVWRA